MKVGKKLREQGPLEVWLVSNWAADGELGESLRHSHSFDSTFFELVRAGKHLWNRGLDGTRAEIHDYCQALRFQLGMSSFELFEKQVKDRMGRYGLKTSDEALTIAIREVAKWIRQGGTRKHVTSVSLRETITDLKLWKDPDPNEPSVTLVIQGWEKIGYDRQPARMLDWTRHFDYKSRRIASPETWDRELYPALDEVKRDFVARNATFLDIRGKLPLTAGMAVGERFPLVGGYRLRLEQPADGRVNLWRSDLAPSDRRFAILEERRLRRGKDLLVSLAITGDGRRDTLSFAERLSGLGALVYAEPDGGSGGTSIRSNEDAAALAAGAKQLIRNGRSKYGSVRTHLIVFGPLDFALLLGQRLHALGDIVTYERAKDGGYQESVTIRSG